MERDCGGGGEIENKTVYEKDRVRERVSQKKERESWRNKKNERGEKIKKTQERERGREAQSHQDTGREER